MLLEIIRQIYFFAISEKHSNGQITYANIFCALCNGEKLENIKPFWGDISCNNLDIIEACGIIIKKQILKPSYYTPQSLK